MREIKTRSLSHTEYVEMLEWLPRNIKGSYYLWYYRWRSVEDIKTQYGTAMSSAFFGLGIRPAKFEFMDDLILFKLRWC